MGGVLLGVRSSTPSVHEALRRALAAHLLDGVEAPPNYSVIAGERSTDAVGQAFDFLYRASSQVLRTGDRHRLGRAVVRWLSSHADPVSPVLVRLDSLALVAGDAAVLAPASLRWQLPSIERRLNARGLAVVDGPWATVDPDAGELVVEEPRLRVDWAALSRLEAGRPRRRAEPVVAPGRYRLRWWAFPEDGHGPGPVSRAMGVALALRHPPSQDGRRGQALLEDLARVARATTPVVIAPGLPDRVAARLARLALA